MAKTTQDEPPTPPQPRTSYNEKRYSQNFQNIKDIVAQINGDFGRWQLRTILLIFLCKIPSAWFMACVIYTAPTPQKGEYYCKPPAEYQNFNSSSVITTTWVRMPHQNIDNENDQRTDRQFLVGACNIFEEQLEQNFAAKHSNYTNPFIEPATTIQGDIRATTTSVNVIPCEHFEHSAEYTSLVTQFDLVCSRQLLVSATQSFHALGALIGGLIAVQALKYVSPRRLMLIGMIFQIVFGNLTGLVNTFHLHVYFRCLTSLFCAFMYTSGQIILADITGGKAKTIVTTLFELFWSIGLILLPGISIFFDSWSYLYVAISSSVIILVFLHRWIADSPRWLLRHNKIELALHQLLESAAFNNREIPLDLEFQLEAYGKELRSKKPPNYWSIWDGSSEFKFLFSIHWAWVGAGILFNVMLLMIRSLGVEHIHVNTACMGFAEMIGVFLGLYFILFTRRRWLWVGYLMVVAGFFTYFLWLVPQTIKKNRRVGFELIFWMFLKLANSASLSVLTTCTGELVSIEKRPLLMISVATFSRIWLVIAPFISVFSVFHKLIPITVFATLALINGCLMCFLSRTFWNREQPRIERVPTLNTYRRNSAIVLLRRNSSCSGASNGNGNTNLSPNFYDNPLTISISDLWHLDARIDETNEEHNPTTDLELVNDNNLKSNDNDNKIRETKYF